MLTSSADLTASGTFGAGAWEPYDHALRDPGRVLHLLEAPSPAESQGVDASTPAQDPGIRIDIERFVGSAVDGEPDALRGVHGPVIDIGCGPGRIVHAAIMAGHIALGIDVSRTAVQIAQERGLPVLRRSVFQPLPAEGLWGTALLIDGNIGIGGDPITLLSRCAELVRQDGRVLVETHEDAHRDRVFEGVVMDDLLRVSLPFPWAHVGAIALRRYARRAGLGLVREWRDGTRAFAEYAHS